MMYVTQVDVLGVQKAVRELNKTKRKFRKIAPGPKAREADTCMRAIKAKERLNLEEKR